MLGVRQHPSEGRHIARQLVRDDYPRLVLTGAQDASQEAFSGLLVTSLLDQDVEYDSVLVDGPPQPVPFATDLEHHLVEVPLVARACSSSAEPGRVRRT